MLSNAAEKFSLHVLREYSMLADGARAALIGSRGDLARMFAPQRHADAVISELPSGPGMFALPPMTSICSALFDMAMAMHQRGKVTEAARWFEGNRAACGSPWLFTGEYDTGQRQLGGPAGPLPDPKAG